MERTSSRPEGVLPLETASRGKITLPRVQSSNNIDRYESFQNVEQGERAVDAAKLRRGHRSGLFLKVKFE